MALGIDGAAHRGALQAGGRTAAVLAGGPEVPYPPSHRELHRQIGEQGVVVSERPPGSRSQRWGFPLRNRLIAALTDFTVMVEGTERSGARHTVDAALKCQRGSGAVPGPVTSPLSTGPNQMLTEGATLIRDASDVLDELFGAGRRPQELPGFIDDDANVPDPVLDAIRQAVAAGDDTPQKIATSNAGLTPRQIARALGELALAGGIVQDIAGKYCLPRSSRRRSTKPETR